MIILQGFVQTNILYKYRICYICNMTEFPKKLMAKLTERQTNNALRKLPMPKGLIDFSSNDYLGLARNVDIFNKASKLLEKKVPGPMALLDPGC